MNVIASPSQPAASLGGSDHLLRTAVRLDAGVSGVFGLVLLAGGGVLADVLGTPSMLLSVVGAVCLVYAAVLWLLQTRRVISTNLAWTIVVANSVWVVASVVLVVVGWLPLTPVGTGFVVLQALVVAGLADLQFIGLRRAAQ